MKIKKKYVNIKQALMIPLAFNETRLREHESQINIIRSIKQNISEEKTTREYRTQNRKQSNFSWTFHDLEFLKWKTDVS